LSTPRTGVGGCTTGNVTALTTSGGATVSGGLVQLPQTVTFPDPPPPSPMPGTTNMTVNNACPAGTAAFCSVDAAGVHLDPSLVGGTVVLDNLNVAGGTNLILKPGIYNVNSISFAGNSVMTLDSTGGSTLPVVFNVAGSGTNTPIDFTGGSISNPTYDPTRFQILYAGAGNVKLTGGAGSSALVYAPKSSGSFSGGGEFYGAVVSGKITDMGGATIHYDRNLDKKALMAGPPTMSEFTWKSF
jgi:hypothetical protein